MDLDKALYASGGVLFLGLLAISIFSIWGLIIITQVAFKYRADQEGPQLSAFDLSLFRMSIVLAWIGMGFRTITAIYVAVTK